MYIYNILIGVYDMWIKLTGPISIYYRKIENVCKK